jgi:choline monooxygenase
VLTEDDVRMREALLDEVDRALERDFTLPPHWFADARVLDVERDILFRRTWQLLGPLAEQVSTPGDFLAVAVAGVPVVLVRDLDGELRGYVNVCRHRGHEVAQGCGNRKTLQCLYHGWTYNLDGTLRAVPRAEREEGFDRSQFPLLPVAVGQWGPFVFVNLDADAEPFERRFAELIERATGHGLDFGTSRVVEVLEMNVASNWKVYVTNTADCYHCPTIHPSFSANHEVGLEDYVTEAGDSYVYHLSRVRGDDAGSVPDWHMYSVWPNWSFASGNTPGSLVIRSLEAVAADHTRSTTWFCADPSLTTDDWAQGDKDNLEMIYGEDARACESVQRGWSSGLPAEGGPLIVHAEHAVIDFQRRMRDALAEAMPAAAR